MQRKFKQKTVQPDNITKAHPEVVADHPVHANLFVRAGVIGQDDANSLPPFLALQQHCVPPKELELIHLCLKSRENVIGTCKWTFFYTFII